MELSVLKKMLIGGAKKILDNKQELNDNDVAKICDIVMRETGLIACQIIIQSKF